MRPARRWFVHCLLTCAIARPAPAWAATESPPPPTVTLDGGKLEGIRFGAAPRGEGGEAFLGIPYAEPPVGDLRWRPPQPVKKWSATRSAKAFGAACPQLPARWLPFTGWNEDCLFLNVWTTDLSADAKHPVIVFLHGGSNRVGYSQLVPVGPALSPLGVVVVSANYRLGPFGFLAHPALTAESPHHSSGNYGLLDQLQALRWVRRNISRFGGDPDRVTVMGQSAGAVDTCLLMSSPLAAGLFQRAIMESGECQSVFNEDIRAPIRYNTIDGTGETVGERLASDLGVANDPRAAEKLRKLPASEILNASSKDPQLHFDAIVDGWVVPEQPAKIFSEGRQIRIPVLVGSNANEATVFGHGGLKTVAQYRAYLDRDTGRFCDEEFRAYPAESDADVAARYVELQSDWFAYGAYSMARAMTRAGQKAYLYDFTFSETGKRARLGAYHGEELKILSGSFPADWEPGGDDRRLAEEMRGYWTQFARTGDPNSPRLPEWPPFDARSDRALELGNVTRIRPVDARLHALERIMNEIFEEARWPEVGSCP